MKTLLVKDSLAVLAGKLATLFGGGLRAYFGSHLDDPVFGSITGTDLAVTACLLAVVLLVNGLAVVFLRRRIKVALQADPNGFVHRFFGALGNPIYLLIWIYGLFIAATPLAMKFPSDGELKVVRDVVDRFLDLGIFGILFWLVVRFTYVLDAWLAEWTAKTESRLNDLFVPLIGKSLRVIVPVIGIIFALPILDLSPEYAGLISKGSSFLLIAAVAWIAFEAVHLVEKAALARYDITAVDNLQARKIYTQVHVLSKTLYFIIGLFAVASILMLFDEVRRFGASILASAGIVGIIIGFAAQKTVSNLFAGFQLAMTQPIRLYDIVIVEGEWGRVEEITLTYVIIHIWDDRRLVVPLSYFIEKPFQNWTRNSANLMGSVFVWVDYSLPLEETRMALKAILETHPMWDKRFWNLQVTDATEKAMQIRVLATATDSSKCWDLRCSIREKLIAYIQQNHPQSLPQVRGTLDPREGRSKSAADLPV